MGLAWTLVAVLVSSAAWAALRTSWSAVSSGGAFFGLAGPRSASVVYALFETRLPELRGQWVAVALLLSWWAGYLVTARRYRWRA